MHTLTENSRRSWFFFGIQFIYFLLSGSSIWTDELMRSSEVSGQTFRKKCSNFKTRFCLILETEHTLYIWKLTLSLRNVKYDFVPHQHL